MYIRIMLVHWTNDVYTIAHDYVRGNGDYREVKIVT